MISEMQAVKVLSRRTRTCQNPSFKKKPVIHKRFRNAMEVLTQMIRRKQATPDDDIDEFTDEPMLHLGTFILPQHRI